MQGLCVPRITAGGGWWCLRKAACFAPVRSCGSSRLLGEGTTGSAFKRLHMYLQLHQ